MVEIGFDLWRLPIADTSIVDYVWAVHSPNELDVMAERATNFQNGVDLAIVLVELAVC